jgi:hypothetical protein
VGSSDVVCVLVAGALTPAQGIPADESASKGQECLVDVGPLFVSDAQAAKLIQPSERPFHHPSPLAQSTAVFSVAFCEARYDVAGTKSSPDCLRVITTVA